MNSSFLRDLILSDTDSITQTFFLLSQSYYYITCSLYNIANSPNAPQQLFQQSVDLSYGSGNLINIILDLLCCKLNYSKEILSLSCAPLELLIQLTNCCMSDTCDLDAIQALDLELIRRTIGDFISEKNLSQCKHP